MSNHIRRANVAIIGAGPAGLAVAHELLKEGHTVTVFEADAAIGGAWQFDSSIDSDPLALDPNRTRVHSSMYDALRTNLPRQLMTLLDFPFTAAAMAGRSVDARTYPSHREVLAYWEAFADAFDLHRHIKLNTRVVRIDPLADTTAAAQPTCTIAGTPWNCTNANPSCESSGTSSATSISRDGATAAAGGAAASLQHVKWRVLTETSTSSSRPAATAYGAELPSAGKQSSSQADEQQPLLQEWVFDAVACCVGIFSEPNVPQVPGMLSWRGLQLHSHNYRHAQQFKGQRVLVVGASFSGEEIARHIACVASLVYHSARTFTGPGTARETPGSSAGTSRQQQQPESQQQQPAFALIPAAPEARPNIQRLPMLQELLPGGAAVFQDGQVVEGLDAVVYCTGFKYSYPWMDHLQLLETGDGHVRPLYLHMFPPAAAPGLSLIGLPWRCAKIPQFQLQGQLLARLLSGRAALPTQQQMMQEQQAMFDALAAAGIPRRYTHCMAKFMPQDEWDYAATLTSLAAGHEKQQQQWQQQDVINKFWHGNDNKDNTCCHQHNEEQHQQHLGPSTGLAGADGAQQEHSATGNVGQQVVQQQQQQQQQQQELLAMPDWLRSLAMSVAGDILGRPDSFRDHWSDEVETLLQQADQALQVQCRSCCSPTPTPTSDTSESWANPS